MSWIEPIQLRGDHALLVPLSQTHHDDLVQAVKDGELWKLWYTFIPEPSKMKAEIERRLNLQSSGGTIMPFAVLNPQNNKAVGMTSYLNIDSENRRVEIGATWYCKSMQRTALNTESKLMLLKHAFETLNCIAVEFRTHAFNTQSRKGIERLGAKLDGILRCHIVLPNNTLRDTCVYSIISSEWPTVKGHLTHQLSKDRQSMT